MNEQEETEVRQFILDQIDSVPHLEALLLLWNNRPRAWSAQDLAKRLYVDSARAERLLRDLHRGGLIKAADSGQFQYESDVEEDRLLTLVDVAYRRDIVRLSTMIHSKPSSAVRDFARAFRFKKERE